MDWSVLTQYGLLGICLGALAWYILRKDKEHREDIKELREEQIEIRKEHKEETTRLTECFDSLRDTVRDLVEELRKRRDDT